MINIRFLPFWVASSVLVLANCGGGSQGQNSSAITNHNPFAGEPDCATSAENSWCTDYINDYYLYKQTPLANTDESQDLASSSSSGSSSGSSSSGVITSSSSSSSSSGLPGGIPRPKWSFAHAPGLDWATMDGWQYEPGAYLPLTATNFYAFADGSVNPAVDQSYNDVVFNAVANNRTKRYRFAFEIRSHTATSIEVSARITDSILILVSPLTVAFRDIYQDIPMPETIGRDWQTVEFDYNFWGSSGMSTHMVGTGEFELRNLNLTVIGDSPIGSGMVDVIEEYLKMLE